MFVIRYWSRLFAAAVIAAFLGCGVTSPDPSLRFAGATNDCAPTDAPAVSLTFATRPVTDVPSVAPWLGLRLWSGIGEVAGRTFAIGGAERNGFGEYVSTREAESGPVVGSVRIVRVAADSALTGVYDVVLKDGTRRTAEFTAVWRSSRTRCG